VRRDIPRQNEALSFLFAVVSSEKLATRPIAAGLPPEVAFLADRLPQPRRPGPARSAGTGRPGPASLDARPVPRFDLSHMGRGSWLAVAAAASVVATTPGASAASPKVLRVATLLTFPSLDPTVSSNIFFVQIQHATCAKLVSFPAASGPRGTRIVPEVARSLPRVSLDGRTYTFNLRRDFRFSDGRRVTAQSFADAINRVLRPTFESPGAPYFEDIVGADAVLAGRAATAAGIRVRGNTIQFQLRQRAPDFPARLTTHYACPVQPGYPAEAPSVAPPLASGPYTITEFDPMRRIVLGRNAHYGGNRPRRPAEIVWLLSTPLDAIQLAVERGDADVGYPSPAANRDLLEKYGVNRKRFFVAPSLRTAAIALNTRRPLFKDNPWLRRAVNFAIDRHALVAELGGIAGRRTDQYLSHAMPGFRDADVYPLRGPNLRKARALAKGHTRSGKVVFYTANASTTAQARAQIVRSNLAQIGLNVEVRVIGAQVPPAMLSLDAPFDMWDGGITGVEYPDPYAALNAKFSGRVLRPEDNTNVSFFNEPRWTRRLDAAGQLPPPRRYEVYGQLDAALAREAAPAVAYATANSVAFVNQRVRCVTLTPVYGLDYGGVCLD
jgi:peptide/nickel transport system substrate-binding protein